MKTTIFYRHPDKIAEALITWEVPQIPRVGEHLFIHIPGLGHLSSGLLEQFDGIVIKVAYFIVDSEYRCYVTFAPA